MVYLNVLTEEALEFLVLAMEVTSVIYKLLTGKKQIVILREAFIEDFPYSKCALG